MKSSFLRDGNTFSPVDPSSLNVCDRLPVGVYSVGANPAGFYFQSIEDFTLPPKLYGNTLRDAERIFGTFQSRTGSTGVLLSGEKGSGKTMLAKKLALTGIEAGMPTIVINESFCGDGFNRFMQGVEQPCIVLFDEFEKIYDRENQARLLTMLDGTFSSKKLFIFTCNDKYKIDSFMRNRPGRIFYAINFRGLDETFVSEYCQDQLSNKSHAEGVLRVSAMFQEFNFDMLKALVEEMNRYGETAQDAMRILNVRPEMEDDTEYQAAIVNKDGAALSGVKIGERMSGSPLMLRREWSVWANVDPAQKSFVEKIFSMDRDGDFRVVVSPELYEGVDLNTGTHIFGMCDNADHKVVLTRVPKIRMAGAF